VLEDGTVERRDPETGERLERLDLPEEQLEPEDGERPLLRSIGAKRRESPQRRESIPLLGIDGLLFRGTVTLLAAHPKSGKTTLIVHACREWVRQGLKVVVLSEEPFLAWDLRAEQFPELEALVVNEIPKAAPERWVKAIRAEEPDVIIVDTVRRFAGIADESDATKVATALDPFVLLAREPFAPVVLLVHHVRKTASGEVQDVSGSHDFAAIVDGVITLLKNKDHPRQRILSPLAGRFWRADQYEERVLELSEDEREYRVIGLAREVLPETQTHALRERVLNALRQLGEATADLLVEHLQSEGVAIHPRTVRTHLDALYQEGAIERTGTGKRNDPYVYACRLLNRESLKGDSCNQQTGKPPEAFCESVNQEGIQRFNKRPTKRKRGRKPLQDVSQYTLLDLLKLN
jgi:DNA-binding transcriptional ArsR family regulator